MVVCVGCEEVKGFFLIVLLVVVEGVENVGGKFLVGYVFFVVGCFLF